MLTGLLGLTVFGWLIAHVVLKTIAAIVAVGDAPMLHALYVLSLLSTAMFLTFALYDQGLMSQRICLFMGVQFGLLGLAPRLLQAHPVKATTIATFWQLSSDHENADVRA